METILVVNAGSSSLKFQLFEVGATSSLTRIIKGQVDGIGTHPRLGASRADGQKLTDQTYEKNQVPDLSTAIRTAGQWLRETQKIDISAVGHRVVHGGPDYGEPILLNADVLSKLERYVPLAPLHQPNNLAPIRGLLQSRPELPQVACFDSAFHRGHGEMADRYALPERLYAEGVRRYGFHGLSYEYIADRLPQVAPAIAKGRVVVAHLGSGASMCALKDGRSIECTLGFTALDGLPMGTRPGQLDPGVVLYLIDQKGMTAAEVQHLLYNECGLKGLSGTSNDVRDLEASTDDKAKFALEYFAYRAGLYTGMLASALGGIDGFVFTAGIGENSPTMRSRIAEHLAWLGIVIDPAANTAQQTQISKPDSRVPLYVIPTNEELMIARHTLSLLSARQPAKARRERTA